MPLIMNPGAQGRSSVSSLLHGSCTLALVRFSATAWMSIACAVACLVAVDWHRGDRVPLSTPVFAAESETPLRLTAIVTDRQGRPLAGLKPSDFEVLIDGQPHQVEAAEITTAQAPRAFAFLLDEFHTPAAEAAAIRDVLLRFVDQQLRSTDLALAVRPLESLTNIKLTMDRAALRKAIERFEGRKGDFSPRTAFERDYMAQSPAAVASARGQIVTSALRAIGLALSQASDVRPAIIFVSDGFERMRTGREVPANLQSAVRIANRAGAPVYAFAAGQLPADAAQSEAPGLMALRALAAQTGGDLAIGRDELENGLARMLRELDTHYVLTYRAPHGHDGKFHAVQIGVKRDGAQVRARRGYVAPLAASLRAALTPRPGTTTRVLRRSSLIYSWQGVTPVDAGRSRVTLTWEPAPARPGTQQPRRAATIVLKAATLDGTVLFDGAIAPATETLTIEIPNRATFEAPGGQVLVDMRILDAKGVVLDTDSRDVTVPNPRKDRPTVFAPEVVRARSAREFREAVQRITTAPVAARDFRRTDRLLFRVPAIDASGAPVPVTADLLNRWRQPMRAIPQIEGVSPPAGMTLFDLPLAPLAPGEYTVRFTVTHPAGSVSEHVTFRVRG